MGLVTEFTVAENMVLDSYYSDRFSRGPQVNWDAVNAWSADAASISTCARPRSSRRPGTCRAATSKS
jgi:ABC-type uncharacterized transport system ATPase subunit